MDRMSSFSCCSAEVAGCLPLIVLPPISANRAVAAWRRTRWVQNASRFTAVDSVPIGTRR